MQNTPVPRVPRGPVITVHGPSYSDGDSNHRPDMNICSRADPTGWMRKIATKWGVEEAEGSSDQTYMLHQLPAGYELFEKPRVNSRSSKSDRYLYGHPSNSRPYDSTTEFYPHFKYLMKASDRCECVICNKTRNRVRQSASLSTAPGKDGPYKWVDDEGANPILYSKLLTLLEAEGDCEQEIVEKRSMDWRAERPAINAMAEDLPKQPAFIPRVGELVLWIRPVDGEIHLEPYSGEYKIFDVKLQLFKVPEWLGGVITQVPAEDVALKDILGESQMEDGIESYGFRVECLPHPNLQGKDLVRDYSYVPLRCIRPFALYREMMHGIPEMSCHPTVRHCLTTMASMSVTERCGFKGSWPNADFYAKGLFHGPESLWVGDAVRILPHDGGEVLDVMVVEEIITRFEDLKYRPKDHGKVNISSASKVSCILSGPIYTILLSRSYSGLAVIADNEDHPIPECMRGYGPWYYMSKPDETFDIDFYNVLGRVYEPEAIKLWDPIAKDTAIDLLNAGLGSISKARTYATEHDRRIIPGTRWFWAEYRTEAIGTAHFGGIDVGRYDTERDPTLVRNALVAFDPALSATPEIESATSTDNSDTVQMSGMDGGDSEDGEEEEESGEEE